MKIYKFRDCLLNVHERSVTRAGQILHLTPKTFDVLQLLVEHPGELISKDIILGTVWSGSIVEEGNLPVHISRLRRSVGESRHVRFIETVPGIGYRFIAPVEEVDVDAWIQIQLPNGSQNGVLNNEISPQSLAVLPFQIDGSDPDMCSMADGFTESIINSLSRLPRMKVLARNTVFRYKNGEIDAKQIGDTLGVSLVLIGRIQGFANKLNVSCELINVVDGTQLWGQSSSRPTSEAASIPSSIANEIAMKISPQDSHQKVYFSHPLTEHSESYRLYLKGKYLAHKRTGTDLNSAIAYFKRSVTYDPINVAAYVETVECYLLLYLLDYLSLEETKKRTAPLLDIILNFSDVDDSVETTLGGIKRYLDWNFADAETHFKNALIINPNNVLAHYRYSLLLATSNRFTEALAELHKILEIDPMSVLTYKRIARVFWNMGRHESALSYLEDVLEIESSDYEPFVLAGAIFTDIGKYHEAIEMLNKSYQIQSSVETLSMIGYAAALSGNRQKAFNVIAEIESGDGNQGVSVKLARIYLALDEKEMVYDLLEKALNEHEIDLIVLGSDPRWKNLRSEQKFQTLIEKIGVQNHKKDDLPVS